MPLRLGLPAHAVETAFERGWATLTNGELLAAAEAAEFDVLVTTDRNLRDQQNLVGRSIALVVLGTTSWPRIRVAIDSITSAIEQSTAGGYTEVLIP